MTDSTAPGYLAPAGSPPDDATLDLALQPVLVGITGLDGTLVRRRFAARPGNVPTKDVDWVAFSVQAIDADVNENSVHVWDGGDGSASYDNVSRSEELELFAEFVGPNATGYATRLRDGLAVGQNRAALRVLGVKYVRTERITSMPDLVNNEWVRRADVVVRLRRMNHRLYPVRTIVDVSGAVASES